MFRRRFLQLITIAGAGSLAPLGSLASENAKSVVYRVKGFSCVTCATGLDTMLCKQSGVLSSMSTYPEGIVRVSYLPEKITEPWIVAFITDLGFTVEGRSKG